MDTNIYIRKGEVMQGALASGDFLRKLNAGLLHGYDASLDGHRWFTSQQLGQLLMPNPSGPTPRKFRLTGQNPGKVIGAGRPAFRLSGAKPVDLSVPLKDLAGQSAKAGKQTQKTLFTFPSVIWAMGFVLFPMLLMHIESVYLLTSVQTRWLVSGYYCLIYAGIIRLLLKIDGAMFRKGIIYAFLTAFAGIPALLAWHNLPLLMPYREMLTQASSWIDLFIGYTVLAGLLEECCKLLPLLFIGMRKGGIQTMGEGVWLGIMSGLGFAWAEGVNYSLMYWNSSVVEQLGVLVAGAELEVDHGVVMEEMMRQGWLAFVAQQVRFVTLPILHAAFTAIAAFGASYAYLSGKWWVLGVSWVGASVIHGLYNSLSDGLSGLLVSAALVASLLYALEFIRRTFAETSHTPLEVNHG